MDISNHIKAKSDQLNADALVSGPITVQILAVNEGKRDQPVLIRISGGHMPFKPSKTALRVLCAGWGTETNNWVNKWVTLYRDESVLWAGEAVGGIRIKAMSHIDKPMSLSLATSKGKKAQQVVAVLKPADQRTQGAATADLDKLLTENGLTRVDVDRWRTANDKGALETLTPDQVAQFAGWLAGDEKRIDAVKKLVPPPAAPPTEPSPPATREPGDEE
jgi:hypothetical protein